MALLLVVILPVYPAFGNYMQDYTGAIVRGNYDESTILATYDGNTGAEVITHLFDINTDPTVETDTSDPSSVDGAPPEIVLVSKPPIVSGPKEDPKKILYPVHSVTPKQTLGEITKQYSVSEAALMATNPGLNADLKIGQKILIPTITWVEYVVRKGDTLSVIAAQYGIENLSRILVANDLSNASKLRIGQKLLLPNPTKDPNPKKPATKTPVIGKTTPKPQNTPPSQKSQIKPAVNSLKTLTYGSYSLNLKVEKGCRNFAWGNCTCFVAKYKNVTWRWNAKQWLKNAQKAGVPTGKDPKPGAIIVYDGYGYSPYYGHVGIVMEVDKDYIIIKDMNYSGLNQITTRREEEYENNRAIKGYIYVD